MWGPFDVLTAGGGMYDFCHPDRNHIAITLVSENDAVGHNPFDTSCHSWGAPVGGLDKVKIEIVVSKYRASHRCHADGAFAQTHLVDYFSDQTMRHAVRTAWAVVGGCVYKGFRA
jgi:hypothetical protein